MKMVRLILALIMIVIIAFACSSKLPEAEYYQLATDAFNKQDFKKSIEHFQNITKYYPEGEKSSEALFMLGYINANNTGDLEAAEKYYKEFIAKYPEDELADDAQYELKHLGKDVNDLPIFQNIPDDSVASEPTTN